MTSKLPEGWKEVELGEVVKIISGGTPKRKEASYWNGDIHWVSVKDFPSYGKYIETTDEKITEKGLNNSSTNMLNPNDIIISARGTVGKLGVVKYPMTFNQSCYGLRSNEVVLNNDFFYYFLSYDIERLKRRGHGSVFNTIIRSTLEKLPVNLPPIEEQRAIADTLSVLDNKIELNNKINENLEEQAQAIFKHWFIDFEFPDENGNPYKSSGGQMIESELGMIPRGWEVKHLQEICDQVIRGFNSKYVEKSKIKNLNQKSNRGSFLEKEHFKYLSEEIDIPKDKYVKQHDILLNSLGQGTLGRIHYYIEDEEDIVVDQHITIIRPDLNFSTSVYLYQLLISNRYVEYFKNLISGSTGMTMLNISKIREIDVVLAPLYLQKIYKSIVASTYKKKQLIIIENEKLSQLRDTLLPKLMSGEIRIPLD